MREEEKRKERTRRTKDLSKTFRAQPRFPDWDCPNQVTVFPHTFPINRRQYVPTLVLCCCKSVLFSSSSTLPSAPPSTFPPFFFFSSALLPLPLPSPAPAYPDPTHCSGPAIPIRFSAGGIFNSIQHHPYAYLPALPPIYSHLPLMRSYVFSSHTHNTALSALLLSLILFPSISEIDNRLG